MGLVCVPIYIHFMGIEAYGLVGIFASLLAIFSFLDMGLSTTLSREMARLAVHPEKSQEMRDLVRTLEIPYWLIGLLIAVVVILASPFIAYHWVNVKNLSSESVRIAVMIMGLAIAFQWPLSFYSGGLIGLERQVLLNGINAVMATIRWGGAVLILWFVSPTVEAFFLWHTVASGINTGWVACSLWHSLPDAAQAPRFRRKLLFNIWRFAAGVTGITVLATILTQLDKIILSRMLSLEMFGYYALAYLVAIAIYSLIKPVFSAVYPQMTRLISLNSQYELAGLYHNSAQLVSVLVLPVAFVVAFFSKEILLLWTKSPLTTEHTYVLVSILVVGTAFNGLMNIPYALQLASGWTRLAFVITLLSVLLLVPLMIMLTNWFGATGAASVWIILNASYVLITIPMMHRRLLPAEKWKWYCIDVGLPFGVALLVAGTFRMTLPVPIHDFALCNYILTVLAITLMATALATPVTRMWIQTMVSTKRTIHGA